MRIPKKNGWKPDLISDIHKNLNHLSQEKSINLLLACLSVRLKDSCAEVVKMVPKFSFFTSC